MRIYLIFLFLLILSCTNPFDTREPKLPEISTPVQPIGNLQSNPDSVLRQLQYAFSEPNWNYYESLIVNPANFPINFIFIPQQDAAYRLLDWTRNDEMNYFRKLTQDRQRNNLMLQIFNVQGPLQTGNSQDTLQIQFDYQIEINEDTGMEYYEGQGICRIFRSSQSLWYLYFWEDFQLNSESADSTWSILKATYR